MADPSADPQGSADARARARRRRPDRVERGTARRGPGPGALRGRLRRRPLPRLRRERRRDRPSPARSARRSSCAVGHEVELIARRSHRRRACTPGARSCRFDAAARPGRPRAICATAVNRLCGPGIVVREASLRARRLRRPLLGPGSGAYRYTVVNRPVPDPFLAATSLVGARAARPERPAARRATRSSASTTSPRSAAGRRASPGEPNMMRRVLDARWHDLGDGRAALRHRRQGVLPPDGAQHHRHAGRHGRGAGRRAGEMASILRARDRQARGHRRAAARAVPLGGPCTDRAARGIIPAARVAGHGGWPGPVGSAGALGAAGRPAPAPGAAPRRPLRRAPGWPGRPGTPRAGVRTRSPTRWPATTCPSPMNAATTPEAGER